MSRRYTRYRKDSKSLSTAPTISTYVNMKRQIPLNKPQTLPLEWNHSLMNADAIPTEEQLCPCPDWASEDQVFYHTNYISGLNTRALVYAAMHALSTTTIPEIAHECYGGCNSIFSIRFPDGFRVAARIPKRRALGSARIASTVAMMTMARFYRGIPVPEVYAWHPEVDNPVGAPYILMEWVGGIEPWRKWFTLPHKERTQLMEDLAAHHANFAKPLPFRGIGNLYFAEPSSERNEADPPFNDALTYRLGPTTPGPACSHERAGIRTWPQTTPESLRDFWLERWQWEVDWITATFGSDRATFIDTESPPHHNYSLESFTIGELLDVAQALLTLIQSCTLPPSQAQLYEPCFAATDYAFRNITMDPETHKIITFLDWDDVYVTPFLLCSRYPEDMCHSFGSGEQWSKLGYFEFVPVDEEGEIEEDFIIDDMVVVSTEETPTKEVLEENLAAVVSGNGTDSDEALGDGVKESTSTDSEETQDLDGSQSHQGNDELSDPGSGDYDGPRRLKDTLLRRQYEQLLITHDARFGIDGFWEMRKDPLKIQDLVMKGWVHWMYKDKWLKERAKGLKSSCGETCANVNGTRNNRFSEIFVSRK